MVAGIKTYKITGVRKENPKTATLSFYAPGIARKAKPGNFLMVWVPGVDEIPLSISKSDGRSVEITVKAVGEASASLCSKKAGEFIGLRGPCGNSFKPAGRKAAIVAGGYGAAPLAFLAERLKGEVSFILGARTASDLLFAGRIRKLGAELILCTGDGSAGRKASAVEAFEELSGEVDAVYTCGPELMMKKVFDIAERKKIKCQASLERWMKCGMGACGSCAMDPTGWMVCRDGPVADNKTLRELGEFGKYKRNKCGGRVKL